MADQLFYEMRGSEQRGKTLGITQRSTPLEQPWTGEMRVRFTDFQVNEIRPDSSVLHLSSVGIEGEQTSASQVAEQAPKVEEQPVEEDKPIEKPEIPAEDVAVLEKIAGKAFADEIMAMYNTPQTENGPKIKPVTSGNIDDKHTRGQIHQEVRRIFQSRIDTSTNGDGTICATFLQPRKNKKRSRPGEGKPRREEAPKGEYLHFTLFKENRDTMDAINQIARMMRIKPQSIGYAGTKDRRASTTQRCSIRRTHPKSLSGLNGKLWGMSTGDYEYNDEPIHLGQLLGNEFVITLKNCKLANDNGTKPVAEKVQLLQSNVSAAISHMKSHGWVNYFGHQRFGTHQIGTHDIGLLILGDKFEEAVDAILAYDEEIAEKMEKGELSPEEAKKDDSVRHQACMLFCTGKDINRAANLMPRRFTSEVCVLRHLTRGTGSRRDFVGSITHITRGMRSMYMHAYQSYVWNHAASKRWEDFGDKVVAGDLVIAESEPTPLVAGQDQDGDDIINPVEDDDEAPQRARPLTEEEAASGKYTIFDIVLPTPGHEVVYPSNSIGTFYEEFMGREENGSLDPHKMQRMRREFSLPGRYRKFMNQFLGTPAVDIKAYADDTEQMHPTDLDRIKGEMGDEPAAKKAKTNDEAESSDSSNPDKIAAIVKFQLGKSAYATVALRELMGNPPDGE
ncbi:hypothetical protein VHEMI05250 [[Torrubiella] hemipterigena]|uniref:TRUD domain-containing protein n=1 Tax=[Torrubiella] hemipterigena TaxID=1531966 RepID=A0A0A1SXF7_9HYPO|nr:hypothetical protein VHEMI05250 [[Torrubiella] hemipterigena]